MNDATRTANAMIEAGVFGPVDTTCSTLPAPPESEVRLLECEVRRLNAEHLLRAARTEIAMLKHAIQTVEDVLLADPLADDFTKGLAGALAAARGAR